LAIPTAQKPDSQGLCFVEATGRKFSRFLDDYIEERPGLVVDENGRVLGKHRGLWSATFGEKSGVCVAGGGRWFVKEKDIVRNRIIIVKGWDNPALFCKWVEVNNWLGDDELLNHAGLLGQVRHRQSPQKLKRVERTGDRVRVFFEEPQRGVPQGQHVAVWLDDRCLGGGEIVAMG
jgi:tRNA-specific 2-thiouridylase